MSLRTTVNRRVHETFRAFLENSLHAAAIAALNNSLRRICTWALVQMCLELRNTVE